MGKYFLCEGVGEGVELRVGCGCRGVVDHEEG